MHLICRHSVLIEADGIVPTLANQSDKRLMVENLPGKEDEDSLLKA